MTRVALGVSYNGQAYSGWQSQRSGNTIQDKLEAALGRFATHPVSTLCAGRTDAGVHGLMQVVHFDTPLNRPASSWVRGTNTFLPADIAVQWAQPVPQDFHARASAVARRYAYVLLQSPVRPSVDAGRVGWVFHPLDHQAMQQAADLGLDLPTGGLFANLNIVNVPNTASYANQAAAVVAAAAGVSSTGNIVFHPQIGGDAGNVDAATSDPLLRQSAVLNSGRLALSPAALPLIKAQWFDLPDLSTPYIAGLAAGPATANDAPLDQANRLTTAMNSLSVINEFNVDPSLAGATDWVFSMPTRRYHVAMDYDHAGRGLTGFDGRVFTSTTVATGADTGSATPNVFNTHFNATNTALDTDKIKICVNSAGITMFDREETTKTSGFVVSPGTASTVRFCGETSVLSFNLDGSTADPSVLGSKETLQIIGTPYTAGWAALATAGNGSPVIGSAYMRLTNAGARAGVSGNYGLVYPHR